MWDPNLKMENNARVGMKVWCWTVRVFPPIGSRDRKPSVTLCWCAWSPSFIPSLLSLSVWRRERGSTESRGAEPSGAERSGAGRADGAGGRLQRRLLFFILSSTTTTAKWRRDTFQVFVRVNTSQRASLVHSHTHKHSTWPSKEQPRGDPAENRK